MLALAARFPLKTVNLVFKLLPNISASEQLLQLRQVPSNVPLTATCVSPANMMMSVQQLDSRLAPSRYWLCGVKERYNFHKTSTDLHKVIQ